MDTYNPQTVFSSIDHYGRYAYANQPVIAHWNLLRFAETLLPLIHDKQDKAIEITEEAINNFQKVIELKPDFASAYNNIFFSLLYMKKENHNFFISLAKKFRSSLKTIDENLLLKYQFEKKPMKLKIGFVSGDFLEHPVSYILLDTLKNLKDKNLELIGYSNFLKKDNFSI